MRRPTPAEHNPYFERYISRVQGDDVLRVLARQLSPLQQALSGLPEERAGFRYAPGKWSVREVVGHLIDTERVFGYRALWFARGDTQPLPSFDEDPFAAAAQHDRYPLGELLQEFAELRSSHVLMFRHLDDAAWDRVGTASSHPLSVRAAAFIMAGHFEHHVALLRERYGIEVQSPVS